jgi:uncharacterized membrane protein (DUF106 family)
MELLFATFVVLALITGVFSGIVLYDLVDRKSHKAETQNAKQEVIDLMKSIGDAHNSMAQQIIKMQDQITGHEMKINLKRP